MNDLIRGFRFEGHVHFHGQDVYASHVDPVVLRRYIGMVFQQPNPFQMSIFDNVAFGLRLNRYRGKVGRAGRAGAAARAALWDEVKDKLKNNGLSLSGGQQQRLCIARAIATEPTVLLMDEPCSALDPIATRRIEELMVQLKQNYTIAIVTHNMQQAMRVADTTAFFSVDISQGQPDRLPGRDGADQAGLRGSPSRRSPRSTSPGSSARGRSDDTDGAGGRGPRRSVSSSEHGAPRGPAQTQRGSKVVLQGAGATFPAPLYKKWIGVFTAQNPDVVDRVQGRRERRGRPALPRPDASTSGPATRP